MLVVIAISSPRMRAAWPLPIHLRLPAHVGRPELYDLETPTTRRSTSAIGRRCCASARRDGLELACGTAG